MDDTESIVRREFDAKAAVYESNRLAPWYMAHADQLLKHLSLQGSDAILDIGCGTGYLLRQVAKSRPGVIGIGVDIAPRMVEMARDKAAAETLPNLASVRSDWECLTGEARALLAKQPIACAVCASTFHYFESPAAATRAIYDVLRPGGALLILERARENSLLTGFWHFLHKYLIGDSVHFYTSDEIAEQSGFHEVRVIAQLRRVFWKTSCIRAWYWCRQSRSKPLLHSSNRDSKDSDPFQDRLSAPAVTEAERHRVPEWFRGLENKRMLVTGAAGFIGGALFERLASYGCDVTGTVLYAHEAEALREQGLKSEVLDLASDEPFDRHVQGIDIVFHVAAMFQETEHGEAMYRKVNDEGALKLEAGALEPSRSGNRARRRVGRIAFGPERTCMVTPTKLRDAARSGAIAPSDGRRGPCKSRS